MSIEVSISSMVCGTEDLTGFVWRVKDLSSVELASSS